MCNPGNRALRLKLYVAPNKKQETQKRRATLVDGQDILPGQPSAESTLSTSTSNANTLGPSSCHHLPATCPSPPGTRSRDARSDYFPHRHSSGDSLMGTSVLNPHYYQLHVPESGGNALSPAELRERLSYGENRHSSFLDEASPSIGPSPGIISYSSASDTGNVVIPAPQLPLTHFEITSEGLKEPSQLSLHEACLVRCFASKLAATVCHHHATHHP